MQNRISQISLLLLVIFFSVITEKVIPHVHVEKGGVVLPDFEHISENHSHEDEHHEEGEELHSLNYEPSFFEFQISNLAIQLVAHLVSEPDVSSDFVKSIDFNVLPKVLSTIIFEIHTYSSKSPPNKN